MAGEEVVTPEVVDPKEANEPAVDAFAREMMDGVELTTDGNLSKSESKGRMPKDVRKMFKERAPLGEGRLVGVSEAELGKLLEGCGGFYSVCARKLGVSSDAIEKRVKKSRYLQEIKKTLDEGMEDLAVNELTKAMKRGEAWAITFYLKCKGGWRENPQFNVDTDGTAERSISFNLIPIGAVEASRKAHEDITEGNGGV